MKAALVEAVNDYSEDGDDIYRLWDRIVNAAQSISVNEKYRFQKLDLTPRYAQVLFVIHALKGRATLTTISRALFLEPSTISVVLIRMKEAGLIDRIQHPLKKCNYRITLTGKGRRTLHDAVRYDSLHRIMQDLSQIERTKLQDGLNRISVQARQYMDLLYDEDLIPAGE